MARRSSSAASTVIVRPTRPSRICQARGRANQGASRRAPKPSSPNQRRLAALAAAAGAHHRGLRRAGALPAGAPVSRGGRPVCWVSTRPFVTVETRLPGAVLFLRRALT